GVLGSVEVVDVDPIGWGRLCSGACGDGVPHLLLSLEAVEPGEVDVVAGAANRKAEIECPLRSRLREQALLERLELRCVGESEGVGIDAQIDVLSGQLLDACPS